ncbi:helix-turn-helix domain-containing protein [Marinifilum sp.]|uniref:helix-turn-helix domain-containing protein n=1 Tax=Marinifilum sp. TaxID=2033137 RepID=UPI003BA9354E
MSNIIRIENISELNKLLNQDKPKHSLISIIDFSKINYQVFENFGVEKINYNFYSIILKNLVPGSLRYGRNNYDFQDGSLFFMAPGQVLTLENINHEDVYGWGLSFHPNLIRGTSLNSKIKEYTFFNYTLKEALHLSDEEKCTLGNIMSDINKELNHPIDKHSKAVIVSAIELLLNHCLRYYERQFITRSELNQDVIVKLEEYLTNYFKSKKQQTNGLPTAKQCAEQVHLSPNYLCDLLKKETGKSTQEHIHYYVVELAKHKLLSTKNSISGIAYDLGFKYPQYFSKLFKKKTGMSPAEYRNLN